MRPNIEAVICALAALALGILMDELPTMLGWAIAAYAILADEDNTPCQ